MSTIFRSPLHKMVSATPTDFWNDSCAVGELKYAHRARRRGSHEQPDDRLHRPPAGIRRLESRDISELFANHNRPDGSRRSRGSSSKRSPCAARSSFDPSSSAREGKKGFLSIQTNPDYYRTPGRSRGQALHFSKLAPNMQVKIPATAAGIVAIEEVTAQGVSINATVCFTSRRRLPLRKRWSAV